MPIEKGDIVFHTFSFYRLNRTKNSFALVFT